MTTHQFSRRLRGFTLVELLVVIAIIGILAALLLPAVQAARERGRQAACTNNVRQLAVAFQLHQDSFKVYPSGGWGFKWSGDPDLRAGKTQPGGWCFSILPYVEQSALFQKASDGDPATITAAQKTGAGAATQVPLEVFLCPSRRPPDLYPQPTLPGSYNCDDKPLVSKTDYAANAGDVRNTWGAGPTTFADGLAGTGFNSAAAASTGICFQRSSVESSEIADGSSNTYLVGEKQLDSRNDDNGKVTNDDQSLLSGDDLDHHAWGFEPPSPDKVNKSITPYTGRFGGSHPGVFIMSLCDGSVRTIRFNIDLIMHQRLANRDDGLPVTLD